MRFYFRVKTNLEVPMINYAVFRFNGGPPVFIDRDTTWFSVEKTEDGMYEMGMDWSGCYIWNGEEPQYLGYGIDPTEDVDFVGFELEDDAGEEYFVEVLDVGWDESCTVNICGGETNG